MDFRKIFIDNQKYRIHNEWNTIMLQIMGSQILSVDIITQLDSTMLMNLFHGQ